ncbi:MAG: hypothetical protein SOW55_05110 [Bacilli bacterium]|nr:hypothetical protein [Bacillales bacterium]MDY2575329.1 hypothetical protein [Bacilli bacterium]
MSYELLISLIGLIGALSSIIFSYLAFKRSNKKDDKEEGKAEGVMISDIGYIKACVDRLEKNFNKVDELYKNISERVIKLETSLTNLSLRIEQLEQSK